jgi:transcriptional regulator with XRE-family HTH domain
MFYDNLKWLCFERGVSVSKMAVDLKISTTTVTGWKRGSRPQPAQLKKIAGYFKISVDELTRETPGRASAAGSPDLSDPPGRPDDRADLMGIIKSQQDVRWNLSESVRHLSEGRAGKNHRV